MAWVYIMECADGTLYTGWTTDLAERLSAHNAGGGARYTRGRGPLRLVYQESCIDRSQAQRRECAIKKLNRQQKQQLIAAAGVNRTAGAGAVIPQ